MKMMKADNDDIVDVEHVTICVLSVEGGPKAHSFAFTMCKTRLGQPQTGKYRGKGYAHPATNDWKQGI